MTTWQVSYDDDGWNSVLRAGPTKSGSELLDEAVNAVIKHPIDTYVWNVEETVVPYPSHVDEEQCKLYDNAADWMLRIEGKELFEEAPRVVLGAMREAGIPGFLGFRVNDPHDRKHPWLRTTFKLDHPEYQLGGRYLPPDQATTFEGVRSSSLDFAIPQVRDYKLSLLESMLDKYPNDGLFLDFFRHPYFFNPSDMERGWDILTGFVREVHGLLCGKPLWARVPSDLSICRWSGIDLRAWVRNGLVDMVIAGGGNLMYAPPSDEMIEYCHQHGAQVQLCIDAGVPRHTFARQRAAARAAHARSVDGLYMFNLFIPCRDLKSVGEPYDYSILDELADVGYLDVASKTYAIDEKEERPVNTHLEPQGKVPFQLTPANAENGYPVHVFVGDSLSDREALNSAWLRIEMENLAVWADELGVRFNGRGLERNLKPTPGKANREVTRTTNSSSRLFLFHVKDLVKNGANEITFILKRRAPNVMSNINVTLVELDLEYKAQSGASAIYPCGLGSLSI